MTLDRERRPWPPRGSGSDEISCARSSAPSSRCARCAGRRERVGALVGVLVGVLAWPPTPPALAQRSAPDASTSSDSCVEVVSAERRARANELLEQGNALYDSREYAAAVARYRSALNEWRHPIIYFNLAVAQLELDRPVEADVNLEQAIRCGVDAVGEAQYVQAQRYRRLLARQLVRVTISCTTPGAELTLDGAPLLACPGRRRERLRHGQHQVVARKPGFDTAVESFALSPGDGSRTLAIEPLSPPPAPVLAHRWPVWMPWLITSAGGALAGVGVALHMHSSGRFDAFDAEFAALCGGDASCTDAEIPGLIRELEGAHAEQWAARGAYAVGALVLAVGIPMIYLNRARIVAGDPRRGMADAPLAITPTALPGGGGVALRVRWW